MNERAKSRIAILLVTCMLLSGCTGERDVEEEPEEISGCMDETAENYNPDATVSDRSCVYAEPEPEGPAHSNRPSRGPSADQRVQSTI